jgi:hypothetical protein
MVREVSQEIAAIALGAQRTPTALVVVEVETQPTATRTPHAHFFLHQRSLLGMTYSANQSSSSDSASNSVFARFFRTRVIFVRFGRIGGG